jgi:hypothetical protein
MSTVAEIEAALPKLSDQELTHIEHILHAIYRQRKTGMVYDDSHGVVTESQLMEEAAEAFKVYDQEESAHADRKAR